MTAKKMQEILNKIAASHHTTPGGEVRLEMEPAMEAGQRAPDPVVQARWNAIPRKGEKLTLEEFIEYVAAVATLLS